MKAKSEEIKMQEEELADAKWTDIVKLIIFFIFIGGIERFKFLCNGRRGSQTYSQCLFSKWKKT